MGQLTPGEMLQLAPAYLVNYRHDRFKGETERAALSDFHDDDQESLRQIYGALGQLFEALASREGDAEHARKTLQEHHHLFEHLHTHAHRFGRRTFETSRADHLRRVVHDSRGGALQAFLFRWEMLSLRPDDRAGLAGLFYLVRDHLKIMRNCVSDLDTARFKLDSQRKEHGTDLLLEKWSHADFYGGRIPAHVEFSCAYQGTVCESCLEFSTVDRITYNLINNAARYADDNVVYFDILPIPGAGQPENLRFIVSNHVNGEHRDTLRSAMPELGKLFLSDFTTGGNGIGTRIVAGFCTQAYGILDEETARQQGYFGARWIRDNFVAWFHWPIAAP